MNSESISGVIQGNITSDTSSGTISSSDGRDFNLESHTLDPLSMKGTYTAKSKLQGQITYNDMPNAFITLTTEYNADYEQTPSLSKVAGSYTGIAAVSDGNETATTTVSATGQLSGAGQSGCEFTGTVIPRSKGNVYDLAVKFKGGVCTLGTDTVNGIAYFDASTNKIYSTTLNAARDDGFLFIGSK